VDLEELKRSLVAFVEVSDIKTVMSYTNAGRLSDDDTQMS
jgi:hypothetical protein